MKSRFLMVVLAVVTFPVLCQEAAPVVAPVVEDTSWWKHAVALMVGLIGARVVSWVADFLSNSGKDFVHDKIAALQEKLNENSLLSQIAADDAIADILQDAIPTVIDTLTETAKRDIADGKFDKVEWQHIGKKLWDEVKDQIEGGKNDYLKNSSYNDGVAIATWVAQNFFKKKKLENTIKPANPAA